MPYFDKDKNEYWGLKEILQKKGEYVSITNIQNLAQKLSRMKVDYIFSETGARLYKVDTLMKRMKDLKAQVELKQNPLKEVEEMKTEEEKESDIYRPDGRMNVLYSRVSDCKTRDREELAKQCSLVLQYCVANGIKIDHQYQDMCPSYIFSRQKREGLYMLMDDMAEGRIKTIYVLSPDVISPFFYEFFIEFCRMHGVRVEIISNIPTEESRKSVMKEVLGMTEMMKKRFGI